MVRSMLLCHWYWWPDVHLLVRVISIVRFVIRTFVLHVSIARPLGEGGKLQLTSDMTELEFALSAFMVENPQSKRGGDLETIGDEYRTLRALRLAIYSIAPLFPTLTE